jgi:putative transposase
MGEHHRHRCKVLADWPLTMPRTWVEHVNQPQSDAEAAAVRRSIVRGTPFGGDAWTKRTVATLGLEHTQRLPGRPKKSEN